jgi:hypothetical protein
LEIASGRIASLWTSPRAMNGTNSVRFSGTRVPGCPFRTVNSQTSGKKRCLPWPKCAGGELMRVGV